MCRRCQILGGCPYGNHLSLSRTRVSPGLYLNQAHNILPRLAQQAVIH
nr:MAG TPA: hypothetical protein [Caudoviricetes sp.]